jgi:hypothetical protein
MSFLAGLDARSGTTSSSFLSGLHIAFAGFANDDKRRLLWKTQIEKAGGKVMVPNVSVLFGGKGMN